MYQYIPNLYFYTATCLEWKPLLDEDYHKKIILDSLKFFVENKVCLVYGFVIMPNHIHLILKIDPEKRSNFQQRFLKFTAQAIIDRMRVFYPKRLNSIVSTQKDRKYHFWERNSMWKQILTEKIFYQKLRYIHQNPTRGRHKIAQSSVDYEFSSALSYTMDEPKYSWLTLAK